MKMRLNGGWSAGAPSSGQLSAVPSSTRSIAAPGATARDAVETAPEHLPSGEASLDPSDYRGVRKHPVREALPINWARSLVGVMELEVLMRNPCRFQCSLFTAPPRDLPGEITRKPR